MLSEDTVLLLWLALDVTEEPGLGLREGAGDLEEICLLRQHGFLGGCHSEDYEIRC